MGTALHRKFKKAPAGNAFAAALEAATVKQVVEILPENWPAVQLFLRLGTQWRVGAAGASGLDYGVAMRFMDRMHLPDADYDEMLEDLAVIEHAALAAMYEEE